MRYLDSNKLRQLSFLFILLALGFIIFTTLKGFVPAFLGALTLYVLMRKRMFGFIYVRKWNPSAAAALLMFTSFIIIMVPVWMVVNMLSSRINFAIKHSGELIKSLIAFVDTIEKNFGFHLINESNLQSAGAFIAQNIPGVVGATFNTLASIAMMYFLLYFMLINGKKMEKICSQFVPAGSRNTRKIGREINVMVVSNAIGIPLIALAQGITAVIAYFILGLKEPLFWFAITCVTAMLPVVGAALAYVPVSIILLAGGHTWQGVVMLIYGFGVVGTVDNLFRMVLQRKLGNTHPLVTILGVIAGLKLFGFIGLIFGPLLLSLFLLLIKIYSQEFHTENYEKEIKDY